MAKNDQKWTEEETTADETLWRVKNNPIFSKTKKGFEYPLH